MFTVPASMPDTLTTPATTTVVGVPMPDVAEATLGVIDLSDTGFVSEDPAVLVWLAAVSEKGVVW